MRSIYDLTMTELVEQYNNATADKGIKPVTRFKDLKAGQSRLFAVIKAEEVDLPPLDKETATPTKAKKAKAEKEPKAKKAKKEKAAKENIDTDEFGVRVGSNRNKLFNLLKKNAGKPVPILKACEAVYGNGSSSIGPLAGVIKGCELTAGNGGAKVSKEGRGDKMTLTLTMS